MENQIETPKAKRPNVWLEYVKDVRKKHPERSYKEILKLAKETYKPVEKPSKTDEKPVKVKKSKDEDKQEA